MLSAAYSRIIDGRVSANALHKFLRISDRSAAEGVIFVCSVPCIIAGDSHQAAIMSVGRPLVSERPRADIVIALRELHGAVVYFDPVWIDERDDEEIVAVSNCSYFAAACATRRYRMRIGKIASVTDNSTPFGLMRKTKTWRSQHEINYLESSKAFASARLWLTSWSKSATIWSTV